MTMSTEAPTTDIETQVFLSFSSAIKNKSTGILKIQFAQNVLRQFAFSQGECIEVATNIKDELPGSFLFQQKVLTQDQYQNYLQKCTAPKTNHWALVHAETQMDPSILAEKRKEHFRKVLFNLKLSQARNATFQALKNLPHDQKIISSLELLSILISGFSIDKVKKMKPEMENALTLISVISSPSKKELSEDQEGLFTVVQHNSTLGDILESSFLEKEKIYRWTLVFEVAGFIRIESEAESDKRKFFDTLSEDKKKNRLILKKEVQRLTNATLYETLDLDADSDAEDIAQAFNKKITKFTSPEFADLFFKNEENLGDSLLEKIRHAHAILSDPEKKKEYDSFIGKGNTGSFMDQSQTLLEEKMLGELGEILKTRKFDEAIQFLMEQIARTPNLIKLYSSLVDLVKSLNMVSNEAMNQKIFDLFKLGIAKSPQEPQLFTLLGEWCLHLHQNSNAIKAFQKALNLNTGSHKIRKYILDLDRAAGKRIIIEAMIQNMQTLNHFEIMGLEPTANANDVRNAYRDLSRNFHPDLFFSEEKKSLQDMAKRVFKEIVASYLLLKDDEKRKEYVTNLFSSQKKKDEKQKTMVPKSIQARRYLDQANQCIHDENYPSAKLNIQLALSHEPDNYLLQKMLKDVQSKLSG